MKKTTLDLLVTLYMYLILANNSFAIMGVSSFRDGIIHFRNSGMKWLKGKATLMKLCLR